MTKNNLDLDEQKKRLSNVFDFLKTQGISQREIADCFDNDSKIDTTTLSHYKSGKIKHIPNKFLEKLHDVYNINPLYIRLQSDSMLDVIGSKLSNFESFVDSWDIVERHSNDPEGERVTEKYLHLTMDKNFYDFLIDVDNARQAADSGISSLPEEIENLKELCSEIPDLQEFVLIPRNNFIKIVKDVVPKCKEFEELIAASEHEAYIEE